MDALYWVPYTVAATPLAHGEFGIFDELLCFGALLVVALAVFFVYGRDLLKPAPREAPAEPEEAAAEKQNA